MRPASSPPPRSALTILVIVETLALVALGFWSLHLYREGKVARDALATLWNKQTLPQTPAPPDRGSLSQINASSPSAAAAGGVATSPATPADSSPAATAPNPLAAIMSMMDSPAMRNQFLVMQKRGLEAQYADVFALFQFSPEQRKRFIDMVADLQVPTIDMTMKLMAGTLTPEEQAAFHQQQEEIESATEARIRDFLGDDNKYALYQQFEDQAPERNEVKEFQTSLSQAGLQVLTVEQSRALTDMMYIERNSGPETPPPIDATKITTADSVAKMNLEQEALNARIASRAASILSPEQLARFRQQQAENLESTKASVDMAFGVTATTEVDTIVIPYTSRPHSLQAK